MPDSQAATSTILPELLLYLSRCQRQLRQLLESCAGNENVTANEWLALWSCRTDEQSPPMQRELADRLQVSTAQVSAMVERLRKKNLIQSCRPKWDRRRQALQTTTSGEQLVEKIGIRLASHATVPHNLSELLIEIEKTCIDIEAAQEVLNQEQRVA